MTSTAPISKAQWQSSAMLAALNFNGAMDTFLFTKSQEDYFCSPSCRLPTISTRGKNFRAQKVD